MSFSIAFQKIRIPKTRFSQYSQVLRDRSTDMISYYENVTCEDINSIGVDKFFKSFGLTPHYNKEGDIVKFDIRSKIFEGEKTLLLHFLQKGGRMIDDGSHLILEEDTENNNHNPRHRVSRFKPLYRHYSYHDSNKCSFHTDQNTIKEILRLKDIEKQYKSLKIESKNQEETIKEYQLRLIFKKERDQKYYL